MKTTVLLADDHAIVREGLRSIIESQPDMKVVGEAEDGFSALKQAKKLAPDVVLLDLAMPKLNGLEAALRMRQESPSTRVLVLSSYVNDEYVEAVMKMRLAGYLRKQDAGREILQAVREACKGNAYFSPAIAKRILERSREVFQSRNKQAEFGRLTPREREVVRLIAEGYANKMITDKLGIALKTVEKHRQAILRKLNLHDTAGLTRYALEHGIIEANLGGRF